MPFGALGKVFLVGEKDTLQDNLTEQNSLQDFTRDNDYCGKKIMFLKPNIIILHSQDLHSYMWYLPITLGRVKDQHCRICASILPFLLFCHLKVLTLFAYMCV